jgi:hypothetical protein
MLFGCSFCGVIWSYRWKEKKTTYNILLLLEITTSTCGAISFTFHYDHYIYIYREYWYTLMTYTLQIWLKYLDLRYGTYIIKV